jgi:hypothetical protein
LAHAHGDFDPAARLEKARLTLDDLGPRLWRGALAVGAAGLAAALALGLAQGDGLRRFAFAYLHGYTYFLTLSVGALFFVALQHITRSSWSVTVRRPAEIVAAGLPLLLVLAVPVLLLVPQLYGWARPVADHHAAALVEHKRAWLNAPFFAARLVLYLLLWSWAARHFWRRSVAQDASADPGVTVRLERLSAPFLVAFGLTLTLASFDLVMSLDPTWFSTIFGVYLFAGSVVAFFALLTLLSLGLQRSGRLRGVVTMEHYHDLGKLMFAFTFFWAYIAFSQFLLIWYANLPEETGWLIRRTRTGWAWLAWALLVGHFLLPFAGLVSRYAKRSRPMLAFWAFWLLAMHWLDLWWLILPEHSPQGAPAPWLDLLCWLGVGGLWAAALVRVAGARSLVPRGDPRLAESLRFENA